MRIAYFDCFCGISGDMILGALVDAGVSKKALESELGKLKVKGFTLKVKRVMKNSISATKVTVKVKPGQRQRRLKDIIRLIKKSRLDTEVKLASTRAFGELVKVEAEIHGQKKERAWFHDLGALDSIVDIVGSFIGLKKLGIEAVYASRVHVGRGFVNCAHGIIPVPAPASLALLKGVPIYSQGLNTELVTPTGAAILKSCAKNFGVMPQMRVSDIGYGAGDKDLSIPNLLRVYIGETEESREGLRDEVVLIETNIDDMQPQVFTYVSELLMNRGALDVYMAPIYMKKNRLGTLLSALTTEDKLEGILATIFAETTTLGIRVQRLMRYKLAREIATITTKFGGVKVKVAKIGEKLKTIAPEYESCKKTSARLRVPFKVVYDEAKKVAEQNLSLRKIKY